MNSDRTGNPADRAAIVASFPPPIVGQTLVTDSLTRLLAESGDVVIFDWLPNSDFGPIQRLHKSALSLFSCFWIVYQRMRGYRVLYTVVNAGFGMYYTWALVVVAKLLGMRCVLHHHAVSYLQVSSRLLARIDRWMESKDVHVVLGPEMETMFRENYQSESRLVSLSNGFMMEPVAQAANGDGAKKVNHEKFRVGHICNLSHAKGTDLVIESFRRLQAVHPEVQFVIAGPVYCPRAQRELDQARVEFGGDLDYRGPVYDQAKAQFFEDIHVMVYPTRDDAQPLVVLESLCYGKPVIATDLGCIPSMVISDWVVDEVEAFPQSACNRISAWVSDRQLFASAQVAARAAGEAAIESSHAQIEQLKKLIFQKS